MKILVLNNIFKKNSGTKRNRSRSTWLSKGQSEDKLQDLIYRIKKKRLTIGLTEGNRGKKSDLLAQHSTICHFKLEQVYKLILIQ